MRASKAGPLILIAGLVVACHRSPMEPDDLPDPSAGPILLGTIGKGKTLSTLIEIDPVTGATLSVIGPVGFVVNGMEFDPTTGTLFGSTGKMDPTYNGLITIDLVTGAGTPVHTTSGFGFGVPEAINNITIDASGQLYGWWEPAQDDLMRIDKVTGIATRVGESDPNQLGFGTMNGGLDFDNSGILYVNSAFPAVFHTVNIVSGVVTFAGTITPVGDDFLVTHHGDFHPDTNVLYALSDQFEPRDLLLVDVTTFTVNSVVPLEGDVHVITWAPGAPEPEPEEECPKSANSSKSRKSDQSDKSGKSDKSGSSGKITNSGKSGTCPS